MSEDQRKKDVAIAVAMAVDMSGLWSITAERIDMLKRSMPLLSSKSQAVVQEMIDFSLRGDRLWTLKAEYYLALNEIKSKSSRMDDKAIEKSLAEIIEGAKRDGVAHRAWVKSAIEIIERSIVRKP